MLFLKLSLRSGETRGNKEFVFPTNDNNPTLVIPGNALLYLARSIPGNKESSEI